MNPKHLSFHHVKIIVLCLLCLTVPKIILTRPKYQIPKYSSHQPKGYVLTSKCLVHSQYVVTDELLILMSIIFYLQPNNSSHRVLTF